MTKTGEEKWRALIAAQEKSGLGVHEFAGLPLQVAGGAWKEVVTTNRDTRHRRR